MLPLRGLFTEPKLPVATPSRLFRGIGVQVRAASKTFCRGHPWHSPGSPGFSNILKGPQASGHPPAHTSLLCSVRQSMCWLLLIETNSWEPFNSHTSKYLAIALKSTMSACSAPTGRLGAGLVTQYPSEHESHPSASKAGWSGLQARMGLGSLTP